MCSTRSMISLELTDVYMAKASPLGVRHGAKNHKTIETKNYAEEGSILSASNVLKNEQSAMECPIFCAVGRVSVAQLFLSSSSRRRGCGEVGSA